MYIYSIFIKYW